MSTSREVAVFHKYGLNRRLYSVEEAVYSTLDDIWAHVTLGHKVIVYLHPGKQAMEEGAPLVDITNQILLKVLLEQEIKEPFLSAAPLLALFKRTQTRALK